MDNIILNIIERKQKPALVKTLGMSVCYPRKPGLLMMNAVQSNCLISLFSASSKQFFNTRQPFLFSDNSKTTPPGNHPWFKRQPVGVNKLSSIMKRMARCVGLQHGHFTNHSARKYLVQKLSKSVVIATCRVSTAIRKFQKHTIMKSAL